MVYELYKEIFLISNSLPKNTKYSLGQSMEKSVLDLLETLIYSKNASLPLKQTYLLKSQANLEIMTMKIRLLLELKLANETSIFQIQAKLQEVGRMLGGWIKSIG